jgi:hypothetical protein
LLAFGAGLAPNNRHDRLGNNRITMSSRNLRLLFFMLTPLDLS